MQRIAILFLLIALSGCNGVKFSNIPQFNKDLPEDFKRRVLWNETDIFKYNLEQLAGHVIYAKAVAGHYDRSPRYIKQGKSPMSKVIDSGQIYHSKIDNGAKAQGSYLAFAASLSNDQTAEVNTIDTAQVFIPYEDVPVDDVLREVAKPASGLAPLTTSSLLRASQVEGLQILQINRPRRGYGAVSTIS